VLYFSSKASAGLFLALLENHLGSLNEIGAKKAQSEVGPAHPRQDDR
jgi:hypothetical protein